MRGKNVLILLLCMMPFLCAPVFAQKFSDEMQAVYDACMKMRNAIGSGNIVGLRAANKAFKKCDTGHFGVLRSFNREPLSLNGHFVFDDVFVDSLIAGRNVYGFAQRYAEDRTIRSTSSSGKIFDRTCLVGKMSGVKYSMPAKGRQELAVVTEPGGMVTLRIYDKRHDKWYNDTEDVKNGRISRRMVIDLPENETSILEIEVINTTEKDISFVIIGN